MWCLEKFAEVGSKGGVDFLSSSGVIKEVRVVGRTNREVGESGSESGGGLGGRLD